jgi:ribosomal protein L32
VAISAHIAGLFIWKGFSNDRRNIHRTNKTLTWNGVTYKIKGMIDVQGKTVDVINAQCEQIYNELGRNALIYTNKGLWDKLEDKSGLKDNISAKTDLFLAWFGIVQPEYGTNNSVLPTGWSNFVLWNDQDGHYKLIKDGGEALATLLDYCEVATDDDSDDTGDSGDGSDSGDGGDGDSSTSSSTIIHMICPKCGAQIF